ncbi:uncharacterized protein EDB93DRAFT_1103446 [Suillus bovinus]|uniref:uncharacterized protein n=1 Tax=Suillus bovinus TaxID=48563 RepID=UPI001B88683D|nr:uncharacterized protein EDB93DRAFT_1103446 [Suillus bovinus]KAG2150749.1 hypothetical protein EDB93DRAFT_1103446 [Suillus bovinus]
MSEHKENAPSIASNQYKNLFFLLKPTTTDKLHSQQELPPRDKKGHFRKKTPCNPDLSDSTFPSSESSPLDTLEIDQRMLENEQDESEYKVNQQLADDDEESLPEAPDQSTIVFPSFKPFIPIPTLKCPTAPNKTVRFSGNKERRSRVKKGNKIGK